MNNKSRNVSTSVIKRLPRYHRFLGDLISKGMTRISSKELSIRMGLTASQIRQDLNCFGEFGQQGYGYNIEQLHHEISLILGLNTAKKSILIGAGHMGKALTMHFDLESKGFQLIGIFDKKPSLVVQTVQGLPIHSMERLDEFCKENKPDMAILCVPRDSAKDIVEQLVKLNIKGFWNFTHYDISVEFPGVCVENVHLSDSLMTLRYNLDNFNHKS